MAMLTEVRTFWIDTGWKVTIWDASKRRIGPVYSVALETPVATRRAVSPYFS
jgi:hypothetical protein